MIKHYFRGPKGGREVRYEFELGDAVQMEIHDRSPKGRKKFASRTHFGVITDAPMSNYNLWLTGHYRVNYLNKDGIELTAWRQNKDLSPQKYFRARLVVDDAARYIMEKL